MRNESFAEKGETGVNQTSIWVRTFYLCARQAYTPTGVDAFDFYKYSRSDDGQAAGCCMQEWQPLNFENHIRGRSTSLVGNPSSAAAELDEAQRPSNQAKKLI